MKDRHDKATGDLALTHRRDTLFVFATTSFIALHKWPEAPVATGYLRSLHRHVFKVRVDLAVTHGDRDVEFIQVKLIVDAWCRKHYEDRDLGRTSCEDISRDIADCLEAHFPRSVRRVEVSEDGENGAVLYRRAE